MKIISTVVLIAACLAIFVSIADAKRKCYKCTACDVGDKTQTEECPDTVTQCYRTEVKFGSIIKINKGCAPLNVCLSVLGTTCCDKDLCNSSVSVLSVKNSIKILSLLISLFLVNSSY